MMTRLKAGSSALGGDGGGAPSRPERSALRATRAWMASSLAGLPQHPAMAAAFSKEPTWVAL